MQIKPADPVMVFAEQTHDGIRPAPLRSALDQIIQQAVTVGRGPDEVAHVAVEMVLSQLLMLSGHETGRLTALRYTSHDTGKLAGVYVFEQITEGLRYLRDEPKAEPEARMPEPDTTNEPYHSAA